jgi:ABC-2 type transport system permease protein
VIQLAENINTSFLHRFKYELGSIYSIIWADIRIMTRNRLRTIATSLVAPLLYLLAFGFGLGQSLSSDGVSYLAFIIPGLVAMTSMTASYTGAGSKLNVDRIFHKCFDELLITPLSLFSIIVGKALIGVVRGFLSSVAFLIIGLAISPTFYVTPALIVMLFVSCFTFSLLGVLAALIAKSHQDMNVFMAVVIVPMTFMSNTFFSLSQLPEGFKVALYFLPLTHASQCLRAEALGQVFPWASFFALIVYALVFLFCGVAVLRRASV